MQIKHVLVIGFSLILFPAFNQTRFIHVLVALCDNVNQGIVPVPKAIGNGQDPKNNLYWGCGYGVKTFFKKQPDWVLIKQIALPTEYIYERLVFKHKSASVFLVADAYNGAFIKQTVIDFLDYSAGKKQVTIKLDTNELSVGGNADLLCYVGHNGLMDFTLDDYPTGVDSKKRETIILACASKIYFYNYLKNAGAYPLLWTTHLMCPEAYTLDAAIDSWIVRDAASVTREKAAQTYNQYLKCGIKGARRLLVTGF